MSKAVFVFTWIRKLILKNKYYQAVHSEKDNDFQVLLLQNTIMIQNIKERLS